MPIVQTGSAPILDTPEPEIEGEFFSNEWEK